MANHAVDYGPFVKRELAPDALNAKALSGANVVTLPP
eukprot:CAMPEP_0180325704 /NCGR_PEP_ID=MMETSP0988-20121125/38580_1 /TAXON_ID=697907 /ORGANISM="non described non described, Strain CCMP2293" /LENGTH=36 /DNA_ID= /DNA_START= /DNA_END= /DNA_ORIENTATION=